MHIYICIHIQIYICTHTHLYITYIFIYIHTHTYEHPSSSSTLHIWRMKRSMNETNCRVAKTHRMPYLYKSFSVKEPYNSCLFCGKWPATQGVLWVFATLYSLLVPFILQESSLRVFIENLQWVSQGCGGYRSPLYTLGVPFALTPIGQLNSPRPRPLQGVC